MDSGKWPEAPFVEEVMVESSSGPEDGYARAARQGDRFALEELTRSFYPSICALARRFFPNSDKAEDIAQETFARVSRHIMEYDPSRRFSSWIFAIATNLCRDQYRRENALRFVEISESNEISIDVPPDLEAIRGESSRAVNIFVDELPFDLKCVVVLHFQHGLSASEISSALEISTNAVRIRLYKALCALREAVRENV